MKRVLRENWMLLLVLIVAVGGYAFLRTPGDELASTAEFDAKLTDDRPLLVYFYSNA